VEDQSRWHSDEFLSMGNQRFPVRFSDIYRAIDSRLHIRLLLLVKACFFTLYRLSQPKAKIFGEKTKQCQIARIKHPAL